MHKFPYQMEAEAGEPCIKFIDHGPHRTEPFDSSKYVDDHKWHLLLCASGSVATIKIPNIVSELGKYPNLSIRLVLTGSAAQFLQGQSAEQPSLEEIRELRNVDGIYLNHDEWAVPWTRGAKILHIELRRWADIMVVAPLSANTLAKVVGGLCDNLLLSTFRAWDVSGLLDPPHLVASERVEEIEDDEDDEIMQVDDGRKRKKIVVAPAMNTAMWFHPITKKHIEVLEGEWNVENGGWVEVLRPVEKELACGDTGSGAMVDWRLIVKKIEADLGLG